MKRQPPPPCPEGLSESEWKGVLEARKAAARREKARAKREAKQEAERARFGGLRWDAGRLGGESPEAMQHRMAEASRLAREDALAQAQQREAKRKLGHRLINTGYKALAKELHPDIGGGAEDMKLLNEACRHLKQMA